MISTYARGKNLYTVEGSEIFWHIHLVTNGLEAVEKFVKFEIEFYYAKNNTAMSSIHTISHEFSIPANTADRTMIIVPMGSSTLTGVTIGSHIWVYLKRVTSTGAAPTSNPFVTMLQAHLECDTIGSNSVSSK